MKLFNRFFNTLVFMLLTASAAGTSMADEPDWTGYNSLLHHYVKAGEKDGVQLNLVDYAGWSKDPLWPAVQQDLQSVDLQQLGSRDERLAFWINAYNILAIKVVLDHQPLQSIRDAGHLFSPVWKQPAGIVGGQMRTLHDVEHEILRSMGEPRVHFAIVCASVSCPDLRQEVYRADQLEAQLDDQARRFLVKPGKGIRYVDGGAEVSKIFDWFEDDFAIRGGVKQLVAHYAGVDANGLQLVGYLDYKWSLNGKPIASP